MRELMTSGNSLVALAAIECGCRFFSGYPITPSSEIANEMSVLLPKYGGHFIQMEDEISGICAAIGASMSGIKAMSASSGPGISLKSEQFGLAFIAEIPIVIVNVMRGGPSTGLPTRVSQGDVLQSRNPTHGDYCSIAIAPGNLSEIYTQTIRAFNLAEKFMTPVFLLLDETLAHMFAKAQIPEISDICIINRAKFSRNYKDYAPYNVKNDAPAVLNPFFTGYHYHITGLHHGVSGFPSEDEKIVDFNIKRLFNKILNHADEITLWEEFMLKDAEICVIAYGSVSLAVLEAVKNLRKKGVKVGLFRPITLWISPEKKLHEIGKKFSKILVCELNLGQYFYEIERLTMRENIKTLFKANGRPISPTEIEHKILEL